MIRFSRYTKLYLLISCLMIIPGVISLLLFGLKPSIDFTGGALFEYSFNGNVDSEIIKDTAKEKQIELSSIQNTKQNSLIIRTAPISQDQATSFKKTLEEKTGLQLEQLRFETIGPILGKELLRKTYFAVFLSIMVILLYIGWSFKNIKFGVAAILALVHDLLVLIGSFSLLGHFFGVEVDSLFVTAVLTTTSFSVHDTIVVLHRIREIRKVKTQIPLRDVVDLALTETMVRSLNNSLTIIFMLTVLVILGGETIRLFALALLIGTITGTYSSPFVATPLMLFFHDFNAVKKSP